jgi:sugar phosphate isomerase/epimerase
MNYTRRDFGKLALAAFPVTRLMALPSSDFSGVQIGIIAPYSFRRTANTAEEVLESLAKLGISAVELQNTPVEAFAGAPGPGPRWRRGQEPTPEQQAARRKAAEDLRQWRISVSMDKFEALRKMYAETGVDIFAFKLRLTETMSDEEYDYCFNVARTLGASHVTMELPEDANLTRRIGEFAAKRKFHVGYHNHTQVNEQSWDKALGQSPYNGLNLDVGHFTDAINKSPIPFIQKHHDRIVSMHLKDKQYGSNGGANLPWGQGDTPLKEILQLMKEEKYQFPAVIELEYPVPEGSTPIAEIAKCVQFCKKALA